VTELNKTEQENVENRVLSFGEHLYVERKRQNLSVADVAKAIHLSEKVIDAIERSDVGQLPQPAFVQGYLRAYAKYLGISESLVLQEYAHAVPRQLETELQPRSTLPSEASSNSPFVKIVTMLVFLVMVAAALYASFSYYKNAIVAEQTETDELTSLPLPESEIETESELEITDQSGVEVETPLAVTEPAMEEQSAVEKAVIVKPRIRASELPVNVVAQQPSDNADADRSTGQKPINQLVVKGDDVLELSADQVSWVEVNDANGVNLYFDLLQQGQQITLKGRAPFKIFLGNAPQVAIKMNDIPVNVDKFIRSNNIAHFRISVDQQQIVFH